MRHILLITLFAVSSLSWADDFKCNPNGNQAELNACANESFARADKELNRVYQALLQKEVKNKTFINKLRTAQKAWIVFRDAELEAMFACDDEPNICWGSMYPMSFLYAKEELTLQRTKKLQQILENGRGQ